MCSVKKLLVILLVFCVVYSSLWAIPGGNQKRYSDTSQKEENLETSSDQILAEPVNSLEISETFSTNTEAPKAPEAPVAEVPVVEEAPVAEVPVEEVVSVKKSDFVAIEAIVEELDEVITSASTAEEKAAASADAVDRAFNLGYAKADDLTKVFALGKISVGFEKAKPLWGVGVDLGLKIGQGLLVSAGANYYVGGFTADTIVKPFDMDRLSFSLGVGWEW